MLDLLEHWPFVLTFVGLFIGLWVYLWKFIKDRWFSGEGIRSAALSVASSFVAAVAVVSTTIMMVFSIHTVVDIATSMD